MKKIDTTPIRKEQSRLLRANGMSYGKISSITGLAKSTVVRACDSIQCTTENANLEELMESGAACRFCGKALPEQSGAGRPRHFCGNTCRRSYWKIHRDELEQKPKSFYTHTCAYCGKTFEVYGKIERKYCNRHCFMLHRNGHKTPESEG